jgi:penicillin-binding protein 2
VLREKAGQIKIERDVLGKKISEKILTEPEPGKSLVLWLDSELQSKIVKTLEKKLKKLGTKKAAAVALDPQTGGILALVRLPSFDNNLFSRGGPAEKLEKILRDPQQPLFNRAISGTYSVGSTIKPLIALAGLEEQLISFQEKIHCSGVIEIPHRYFSEIIYTFRDWKAHGWTDLKKALAQSCNVYFYLLGGGYKNREGLGPTKIRKYLELFGWGKKTGIDLPGEAAGLLPSPTWKKEHKKENWWDGDTYHLSIGQGDILVSPLQVAVAFGAIANGGRILKPQIVKEIIDSETKKVKQKFSPQVLKENFLLPENLRRVREGMLEAVQTGSAIILKDLPVKVAAKTGTAQTSLTGRYHNWVTIFAPYENPQLVLTLVIENVKEIRMVVLPVAKEILDWYFSEGLVEKRD